MIKVYYTALADFEYSLYTLLNKVNEQRRSKILRCKNEKDKQRSLIAGLLLRFALEQEGIDYEKAEFACGEHGKPLLCGVGLFFSLTHCGNYVACVVSDKNVGIDIEETDRKLFLPENDKQLILMVKRICTESEYAYFSNLPKEEWVQAYLEIWTRKESLAKADGRGLAIGFEQIEVLETEGFETWWITDGVCMSIYSENITKGKCCYLYVDCKELL